MRKSKVMLTILAAAMAASLTACGGSSDKGAATTAAAAGGSDTKTEAAGSTASADAINFTMSLVDNTSSNYYKGAEKIAECVEKATDGKITLTIQAGGTLGGESDTLDMAVQANEHIALPGYRFVHRLLLPPGLWRSTSVQLEQKSGLFLLLDV